jgi:hypothetical protein
MLRDVRPAFVEGPPEAGAVSAPRVADSRRSCPRRKLLNER